jgi:hypothetical protein
MIDLNLRGSLGHPSLASMQDELLKLELIRKIDLPANCLEAYSFAVRENI